MSASEWAALGVFAGTVVGYILSKKKKDFRAGFLIGVGTTTMVLAFLSRLF